MREIVLDTETTGLDPLKGHRVVEIGCVELHNHIPTGKTYHVYLNPERDMPPEAEKVHGLSSEFLEKQPVFAEVVDAFLEFIGDAPLVIHNAGFDMNFLNAELRRTGFPPLPMTRAIDTVLMARKMFPGAPASLDALCKRFEIDLSTRSLHGALLDSQLLAGVYLELNGGLQPDLELKDDAATQAEVDAGGVSRTFRTPRAFPASDDEIAAHETFLGSLKDPIWKRG